MNIELLVPGRCPNPLPVGVSGALFGLDFEDCLGLLEGVIAMAGDLGAFLHPGGGSGTIGEVLLEPFSGGLSFGPRTNAPPRAERAAAPRWERPSAAPGRAAGAAAP